MKDTFTITFTGDIGFDGYLRGAWEDPSLVSEDIRAFLRDSDHCIGNPEGVMTNRKPADVSHKGAFLHALSPDSLPFLSDLGINVWNLSNNHTLDGGRDCLSDMISIADSHDIRTIGTNLTKDLAKTPLIYSEAGGIGILSLAYQPACKVATETEPGCIGWRDFETIEEIIGQIHKTCRHCIVIIHGGEEFSALPIPYIRDTYLRYLSLGAEIVVGHHPHVPMNYETVGKKVIFYSLGNFLFDTDYQRYQYHTEDGVLLKMAFTKSDFTWEAMGIHMDREERRLASSELPAIFTDICSEEYEKLLPLSAHVFLNACKKRMMFLYPDRFLHADEAEWNRYFFTDVRPASSKGEQLDFTVIVPLAKKREEETYRDSSLKDVVNYLLSMEREDETKGVL